MREGAVKLAQCVGDIAGSGMERLWSQAGATSGNRQQMA
jgi:hypothetical protein